MQGTNIRLLNVAPGSATDILRCSLRIVDLEAQPVYTALSYSWEKGQDNRESWSRFFAEIKGSLSLKSFQYSRDFRRSGGKVPTMQSVLMDGGVDREDEYLSLLRVHLSGVLPTANTKDPDRRVLVNNRTFKVSPNLYDALLQLRQKKPGDYWIDAVCMNQKDDEEKTVQVQMMGRIYHQAENVLVWLGACPAPVSVGMKKLKSLSESQTVELSKSDTLASLPSGMASIYLVSRRWFRRLWVVQELCLARRVSFLLGEHDMDTATVLNATKFLTTAAGMDDEAEGKAFWEFASPVFAPPTLFALRETLQLDQQHSWTLETWLQVCRRKRAKDPRDLIFAGLGLIKPELLAIDQTLKEAVKPPPLPPRPGVHLDLCKRLNPPKDLPSQGQSFLLTHNDLWSVIRANYKAQLPEVLLNLAACLLSQPNGVDLLFKIATLYRGHSSYTETRTANQLDLMPSWIPYPRDWDSPGSIPSMPSHFLEPYAWHLENSDFSACTNISMGNKPRISSDGSVLSLDAYIIDSIPEPCPIGILNCLPFLGPPEIAPLIRFVRFITKLKQLDYCSVSKDGSQVLASPLQVLARVLAVGMCDDDELYPPEICSADDAAMPDDPGKSVAAAFCNHLGSVVHLCLKMRDTKPVTAAFWAYSKWANNPLDFKEKVTELEQDYHALCATYPNAPWPNKETSVLNASPEGDRFFSATMKAMTHWRRVFASPKGYIGVGPSTMSSKDKMMLIKDCYVPYIVRHVDDDLEMRTEAITRLLRETSGQLSHEDTQRLSMLAQDWRARRGTQDAWRLVGEAYVEGIMHGQLADKVERENGFKRMSFV